MKIGKYENIVIAYNGKTVCQGPICNVKTNCGDKEIYLVSIDNKHFFNLRNREIEYMLTHNTLDPVMHNEELVKIPLIPFNQCYVDPYQPMYIEYTKDELDPEVEPLVKALNNIGIETIGSCSGHGIDKLWVSINIKSMDELIMFYKLFSADGKFKDSWILRTSAYLSQCDDNKVMLLLESRNKGQKAFKAAEMLSYYLELTT